MSGNTMLSIIPFDRLTQRDSERPFKAYPRTPVSLPSSTPYYGPFTPPTFVGSVSIPATHTKRSNEIANMDIRSHSYPHMDPHTPGLMDISQTMSGRMPKSEHTHVSSSLSYDSMRHMQPGSGYLNHNHNPIPTSMDLSGGRHTSSMNLPTSTTNDRDSNSSDESTLKMPPKKRPLAVPVDMKDGNYWDKRKKNNESAKRSRDQRRMKEEQIAMRVVYLEQDNLQLRTEVSLLKSEIEKLRCMLYNS